MKNISRDLISASAVPIILSVLKDGDNYGYEIVQKVNAATNGSIMWNQPSIYPVLKRLEENGYIRSYWKVIENERPRKYYTILPEGEKQLKIKVREWETIQAALKRLVPIMKII